MIINEKYQAMNVAISVITFCCLKLEYLFNKYNTTKNNPTISTINGAADMVFNITFFFYIQQNNNFNF